MTQLIAGSAGDPARNAPQAQALVLSEHLFFRASRSVQTGRLRSQLQRTRAISSLLYLK